MDFFFLLKKSRDDSLFIKSVYCNDFMEDLLKEYFKSEDFNS